jgi:hypothetical protein
MPLGLAAATNERTVQNKPDLVYPDLISRWALVTKYLFRRIVPISTAGYS